jgi:hypothetical protein
MHVADGLPAVAAGIEDDPVARLGDALGGRYLVRVPHQIRQQPGVRGGQVGQIGVVIARDDQHMNRRLRINVAESDRPGIFGHYGCRYVSSCDPAEQAVRHAADLNVCRD